MTIKKDKIVEWIGRLMMIGGLLFLLTRLYKYKSAVVGSLLDVKTWCVIIFFSIGYAAISFFLAYGWWRLLCYLPWGVTCKIYARSQVSKYLPGNIFHVASRYIMVSKLGVPHSAILFATMFEFIMVTIAAGIMSLFIISGFADNLGLYGHRLGLVLGGGIALVIFGIAIYKVRLKSYCRRIFSKVNFKILLISQASYILFIVMSAVLFYSLMVNNFGGSIINIMTFRLVIGAYAVSWLVGFLLVGAPAGLGVRESMMIWLLSFLCGDAKVINSIIMFRIVSIIGDFIFFATSYGLMNDIKKYTQIRDKSYN